jgi:hypothetical protein
MKTETRPRYDKGQLLWPVTGGSIPMPVYLYKGLRRRGWKMRIAHAIRGGEVLALRNAGQAYDYGMSWKVYEGPGRFTPLALRCPPEDAPLMLAAWDDPGTLLATDILTVKINRGHMP